MLALPGYIVKPFAQTTLREIVHITNGGEQVRVRFTNAYGSDPLTIADAHVGISGGGSSIVDGTDHALTFGGDTSVRIAPGAEVYSDPAPLVLAPLTNVAISFYLPNQVMRAETFHHFADQNSFMANGDVAGARSLTDATGIKSWYFVDGVEVPAVQGSRAIVTLGDSITDGACSTIDTNSRWPDVLATRLKQEHGLENVSVLNQGIGGNRVLNEDYGPSALSRLNRDVLAQNGAKDVIVLEGINDIGRLGKPKGPEDEITAENLEFVFSQIADSVHQHGMKIFGATITANGGSTGYTDKGEQVRESVNAWIRTSGTFDGVIDFDDITQDPAHPKQLNPVYDCGDHLHFSNAGYKAMGEGIDLKLFGK
jgi:lysophospholipase L1-like esterase